MPAPQESTVCVVVHAAAVWPLSAWLPRQYHHGIVQHQWPKVAVFSVQGCSTNDILETFRLNILRESAAVPDLRR